MFANGGRPEWYIGSADLMERNLDRRVEVVTPVDDPEATARLARVIEVMLADDRRSWLLQPDGALDPDRDRPVARRARSRRSPCSRRMPWPPSPLADAPHRAHARPGRWTRARDGRRGRGAAARGRAQVPDDRHRRRRPAAGDGRPRRSRMRSTRSRRWSTRTATSTRRTARWWRPAGRAAALGRRRDGDHAQGPRTPGRRAARSSGARSSRGRRTPTARPGRWPASAARDTVVEIAGDRRSDDRGRIRQVRRKRATRPTGRSSSCRWTTSRCSSATGSSNGSASSRSSCGRAARPALEPLVDLLAEVEELVPADTSKLERALEAVRREAGVARATRRARPSRWSRPPADARVRRRRRGRDGAGAPRASADGSRGRRAEEPPTAPRRPPSRRASSSPRRPGSSPRTTSRRPAARSSGSTSRG